MTVQGRAFRVTGILMIHDKHDASRRPLVPVHRLLVRAVLPEPVRCPSRNGVDQAQVLA